MPIITIYADYVCPFCLLAERMISKAISNRHISIDWRAFELRPYPAPTLKPEATYLPTIWQQSVYPLAERLGVPIQLPSISPQPRTTKAFELLIMAQDKGLGHDYSMRVFQVFFQQNRDIGDIEVLIDIAQDIGLDKKSARQALEEDIYSERHREALRHANEDMNITSVPTMVIGRQIFRKIPPIEQLRGAISQFENDKTDKNFQTTKKESL